MAAVRIIALDISTVSGAAFDGPRAGAPMFSTTPRVIHQPSEFGPIYVKFRDWLVDLIGVHRPDHMAFEAPWIATGPRQASRFTNVDVALLLLGLAGVAEEVGARMLGSAAVWKVSVQTARKHFVGHGRPVDPKTAVRSRCRQLGFGCQNEHEADAAAIWSFAKSQLDKTFAGRDLPLVGASIERANGAICRGGRDG